MDLPDSTRDVLPKEFVKTQKQKTIQDFFKAPFPPPVSLQQLQRVMVKLAKLVEFL